MSHRAPGSHRAPALLAVGAALGLAFAAAGLLRDPAPGSGLPPHAVARVNGELVLREEYERTLAALASDRREPIDENARRHVLDRLIDEELLVQRGLELQLPRHDRRVRADLTAAVIASVVSEAEEGEPSAAEVADFYEKEGEFFTRPGRVWVREIFIRAAPGEEGATARAGEAARRLRAGERFEALALELGDEPVAPLPDTLLPLRKLREYLGPTPLRAVLELEPGEVSDPVRSGGGLRVLQLREREQESNPALSEIEAEVRAELRRRLGDRALRAYLAELRGRADVTTVSSLP